MSRLIDADRLRDSFLTMKDAKAAGEAALEEDTHERP